VENRGKVVVVGVGKSGHIGEKIAATLTSTGSPAVVLNSLNALHGDLGVVADGDVVLALSSSGETDELVNILPALSRFDVRIIAMTGHAGSFLAKNCHIHLDVNVAQEACPLNLAPTSSTTVMLVLGDALAMVLLEARGFRKEDFARFHPGGMLGRALLVKVSQIMRGTDQMAIVPPDVTVREALRSMKPADSPAFSRRAIWDGISGSIPICCPGPSQNSSPGGRSPFRPANSPSRCSTSSNTIASTTSWSSTKTTAPSAWSTPRISPASN
jgi:arabinose-5-phosphate isomerase